VDRAVELLSAGEHPAYGDIHVLRAAFTRRPGAVTYEHLLGLAARTGRSESERVWALAAARSLAKGPGGGAALVDIALHEGDLDSAWAAAQEYGPGHQWETLAQASAESRPIQAAELYRPHIERDLASPPNTRLYSGIAQRLATMRDLYLQAGREKEFTRYIAEVRSTYKRRTALIAALDRKRL